MPFDLALCSTPIGSNYPCLELIFIVPVVFEPLKLDCTMKICPQGVLYLLGYKTGFTNGHRALGKREYLMIIWDKFC